jgi:hypothetical protein
VEFVPVTEIDPGSFNGALLFGADRDQAVRIANRGVRSLALLAERALPSRAAESRFNFTNVPSVAKCFRGRSLEDSSAKSTGRLEIDAGDEVLARKGEDPCWVRYIGEAAVLDLVSMELPELGVGEHLFKYFCRERWMGLLPVMHLLRGLSPWRPPPLRACFMFDDPNLHWRSYGYVDYRELAQEAREQNYHASFATVPLDAWYVNRGAASIFRQNPDRLSLLIHGNNHTTFELSRALGEQRRRVLATQALRRIEGLERTAGLEIPRVMAAPHGACSQEMATVLVRAGFEAACISRGSLMNRNRELTWPTTIGLNVSEFLGDGLPIIPRFNIQLEKDSEFNALLAAFLGQPIIPVGHHDDLARGLDLLSRLAGLINSTGEVQWLDMKSMSRTNFCTHQAGVDLHVKMYSRRIGLKIPDGVIQLHLHRPWLGSHANESLRVRKGQSVQNIQSFHGEPLLVEAGESIEITSIPGQALDGRDGLPDGTPLAAIVRRQLCEGRDRLRPMLDRLVPRRRGSYQ